VVSKKSVTMPALEVALKSPFIPRFFKGGIFSVGF
jgi:hypothetical protein